MTERTTTTPKRGPRALATLAAAGVLALAGGCTAGLELQTAPEAREIAGAGDAAIDTVGGVEVVAHADAWNGEPQVPLHVTPMRVQIENRGDEPVRIRYDQFSLVAADGRRYDALPPFAIEGRLTGYEPIASPLFTHSGFYIAPPFAHYYPALPPYDGFHYDPFFYDSHYGYWETTPLPTPGMLARAIPEGVVDPGGKLDGYLYFEKVEPDAERLIFRAELVDAAGDAFGEATIPFVIRS